MTALLDPTVDEPVETDGAERGDHALVVDGVVEQRHVVTDGAGEQLDLL